MILVIFATGTRGDVLPLLRIAREIGKRRELHQVYLLTHECHRNWAKNHGPPNLELIGLSSSGLEVPTETDDSSSHFQSREEVAKLCGELLKQLSLNDVHPRLVLTNLFALEGVLFSSAWPTSKVFVIHPHHPSIMPSSSSKGASGSIPASMLAALHAARDVLPRLSHEIWFAGLAGEEAGQHGAHALASLEKFDLVIAGEPTELDFVHTHKGSMFITLTTRGIAVHSAKPEAGYNAIYPMADVLRCIRDEIADWLKTFTHPVLGHSTVSAGTIRGGSKTNVVPDFCQATVDIRLVPGQDAEFEAALFAKLRHVCPDLEITVHRSLPLFTDPAHPLLDQLGRHGARPVGAPWFCDAAVFAKHGSPSIAMGPGSIAQAHTKDEWITVEDLEKGAAFFESFLRSLVRR